MDISFLKKIGLPKLWSNLAVGPASFVGIDIGNGSVKVVQLRKERGRAILETYGELKVARYFQSEAHGTPSTLSDEGMANLLKDALTESNVTTKRAVFGIPATSSFITSVRLPLLDAQEMDSAVSFEARKYIPIPLPEVAFNWQELERNEDEGYVLVLLVAVPNDAIAKYRRASESLGLTLEAMEVESFSLVRSLLGHEVGVNAIINFGATITTVTIVDRNSIRMNVNFGHGSQELTLALARGLGITADRAEAMKKEVGLSEKPENREISDIMTPVVDSALAEVERVLVNYNRGAKRKVEKVVLTGGGALLVGLVDNATRRFGLEATLASPFARTVFPAFLQPVLKDIAPNFSVAVGLALRQIASA